MLTHLQHMMPSLEGTEHQMWTRHLCVLLINHDWTDLFILCIAYNCGIFLSYTIEVTFWGYFTRQGRRALQHSVA